LPAAAAIGRRNAAGAQVAWYIHNSGKPSMPHWLEMPARVSLLAALISSLIIGVDLLRGHRQRMWIMNLVWPLTALYSGPVGLWFYFTVGRLSSQTVRLEAERNKQSMPGADKPFWQSVGVGAMHCGSGCVLGDIIAEWFVFVVPLTLFGKTMFAAWVIDYALAFLFGVAFQYFTVKPMRGLSVRRGLLAAVKADVLSLSAWQIGMYGWALAVFLLFGQEIPKTDPVFWFMMQIAMLTGLATSYPVNVWLLRRTIKEAM
jgi:hypothetical protein